MLFSETLMSVKIETKILLLAVTCRPWLAINCRYLCISCLIDINECDDTSLFSCPDRTECVNVQGNYTCKCAPGYGSTANGKTRGLDIQCEGDIIFDLEGSGEFELLKHLEPPWEMFICAVYKYIHTYIHSFIHSFIQLSNPQTTGNSGSSLKRSIFFALGLLLVYF